MPWPYPSRATASRPQHRAQGHRRSAPVRPLHPHGRRTHRTPNSAVSTPAQAAETLPLPEAVSRLPVAIESRDGYTREAFRHWNSGDDPTDGCSTRHEVLLDEAVEPRTVGSRCALSGGLWFSYYDQVWVTSASGLDIDHMVPLAESWDSGASAWSAQRREAYANDRGAAARVWSRSRRGRTGRRPTRTRPSGCRRRARWRRRLWPRWRPAARSRP
jgi:hypothetical protein